MSKKSKLKLRYNPIYKFTLSDIYDQTDEQMTFGAKSRPKIEWSQLMSAFRSANGEDVECAIQALALALVWVEQDGKTYQLNGVSDIQSIRESIEGQEQGLGDAFILNLATGHYNLHWTRMDDNLKNSKAPSPVLNGGASKKQLPSQVAKQEN